MPFISFLFLVSSIWCRLKLMLYMAPVSFKYCRIGFPSQYFKSPDPLVKNVLCENPMESIICSTGINRFGNKVGSPPVMVISMGSPFSWLNTLSSLCKYSSSGMTGSCFPYFVIQKLQSQLQPYEINIFKLRGSEIMVFS